MIEYFKRKLSVGQNQVNQSTPTLKQVCALIDIYNKIKLTEVELYPGFEGVQNDTLQLELRFINIYFNFKYI